MGLTRSIFTGELVRWIKNHSTIFTINLTSSIGLAYFWKKEQKYLVPAVSLVCLVINEEDWPMGLTNEKAMAFENVLLLGGSYLYSCKRSRDKVSPADAIVVTGCDSGLGYSLALHCRSLGATVIASVLRHDGPGAEMLRKKNIFVYPLDVTKKESVADFSNSVQTLLKENNLAMRCLINNSGVMIFGEFEWQTEDQIRDQVEVNLLGTMRITRELMPIIRAHSSRIIMVSSHCTSEPLPGVAIYGASKAAINAWATAIRVELKKYGIKVVCFVPGSFTAESNILARQLDHFEIMKTSMSEEAKRFYGDYFTRYSQYFAPMTGQREPKMLQNSRIFQTFESCLLDRHPSAVYKCEPWRYFFYHTLFKIMPFYVRDLLVERFVQLPPWKGKSVQEESLTDVTFPVERKIAEASSMEIVRKKLHDSSNEREI